MATQLTEQSLSVSHNNSRIDQIVDIGASIDTKGESYAQAGATTKTGKTLRKGANWDFSMVDLPTLKTSKSNAQGILS